MTLRRALTVTGLGVGAAVLAAVVVVVGLRLVHGDILPGVTVAGVDLGGSEEAARQTLAALDEQRRAATVTVTTPKGEFTLQPETVGYRIDVEATIDRARQPGRTGNILASSWDHVSSIWSDTPITSVELLDEDALREWVASIAAEVDEAPFPGTIEVDPGSLTVTTQPPGPGAEMDATALIDALRAALRTDGPDTVAARITTIPARIDPEHVEAAAERARAAVTDPLVLTANGETLTLSPAQIATLLMLREINDNDTWTVELAVAPEAVEAVIGERGAAFETEPVDASFDLPREPPATLDDKGDTSWTPVPVDVRVVPSRPGQTFDPELAATQIGELLRSGTRSAELRLRPIEADFTTEDAEGYGLTHLIGTFTSYHACCASRVTNIQLLADMVDNTTVDPGEQFSINEISGERLCTKGFRAAGMILNGELVDVCGGGVSQFGTTTFNAAFFAGLPIDAYKAHSWYISRYPMGREATLNYPSPDIDVRWTNDTGHGILVRTSYTGTSITVSLYGDNGGAKVSAIHGSPGNYRGFSTQTRENKALPPGAQRTVQGGAQGFDVTVVRVIERSGEPEVREDFFTRYVPITQIIERNSDAPAPEPEPEPEPEPSSKPKPKPSQEPPPSDEPEPGR